MHFTTSLSFYRFTACILGFMILGVSTVGALSIVWMRQQISQTAYINNQLEKNLKDIERDNNNLAAQIARVHNPEFLTSRMSTDLRPTREHQVVWMVAPRATRPMLRPASENPVMNLAERRETPLSISFDLALLDTRTSATP